MTTPHCSRTAVGSPPRPKRGGMVIAMMPECWPAWIRRDGLADAAGGSRECEQIAERRVTDYVPQTGETDRKGLLFSIVPLGKLGTAEPRRPR